MFCVSLEPQVCGYSIIQCSRAFMTHTILYLLRHGSVVNPFSLIYGRVRDVSLSENGKVQMKSIAVGIKKKKEKPVAMYVSSLIRTRQSAEQILSVFPHIETSYHDELRETDSHEYVGRPLLWSRNLKNPYLADFQKQYHYWLESEVQQIERIKKIMDPALALHKGNVIVVVSHGDPLAFYLDYLLHPNSPLRTIEQIKDELYLLRGEAWRVELSDDQVVSHERLVASVRDSAAT